VYRPGLRVASLPCGPGVAFHQGIEKIPIAGEYVALMDGIVRRYGHPVSDQSGTRRRAFPGFALCLSWCWRRRTRFPAPSPRDASAL